MFGSYIYIANTSLKKYKELFEKSSFFFYNYLQLEKSSFFSEKLPSFSSTKSKYIMQDQTETDDFVAIEKGFFHV